MKQWHTITFSANLDQDDIKAMKYSFPGNGKRKSPPEYRSAFTGLKTL